jgi:hypothetical protein
MVVVVTRHDFVGWHVNIIAACHATDMWLMITILCILTWTLVKKLYNYWKKKNLVWQRHAQQELKLQIS